jgi:hypothetical protein
VGRDLLVTFTTTNYGQYALEVKPAAAGGTWSNLVSGIAGTGSPKTATNFGAASLRNQYYRVRFSVP